MDIPGRAEPVVISMELDTQGDRTQMVLSRATEQLTGVAGAEQGSNMLLDSLTALLA